MIYKLFPINYAIKQKGVKLFANYLFASSGSGKPFPPNNTNSSRPKT